MNKIEIYEGNSVDIAVTINVDELSGFTCTFYVKKNVIDTTYVMEITGSTSGSTVNFRLEEEDTAVTPGNYLYECVIVDTVDTYTVNAGQLVILDSLQL